MTPPKKKTPSLGGEWLAHEAFEFCLCLCFTFQNHFSKLKITTTKKKHCVPNRQHFWGEKKNNDNHFNIDKNAIDFVWKKISSPAAYNSLIRSFCIGALPHPVDHGHIGAIKTNIMAIHGRVGGRVGGTVLTDGTFLPGGGGGCMLGNSSLLTTVIVYTNIHFRRNGYWTKWVLDEMAIRRTDNWTKWVLDEMSIGLNGNWTNR